PLPVATKALRLVSPPSPVSLPQIPPSLPSGVTFSTAFCASVCASYAITQPWYGSTSHDEPQARYTVLFARSSAARGFSRSGSKRTSPFLLPSPFPRTDAAICTGPPNFPTPVVIAGDCSC